MKILIVDDEPGMLTLLKLLLDRLEYESVQAANGKQALVAIKEAQPEFIITDLMMPDMSGQALIQEIRTTDPDIPILVATAVTDTHALKRVVEYGANHVINKPITRASLKDAIDRTLNSA